MQTSNKRHASTIWNGFVMWWADKVRDRPPAQDDPDYLAAEERLERYRERLRQLQQQRTGGGNGY